MAPRAVVHFRARGRKRFCWSKTTTTSACSAPEFFAGINVRRLARHGADATRVVEKYNGTIDLLLTDIVMPGANGRVLAEGLMKSISDLKVLYTSGYTDSIATLQAIRASSADFIQKSRTFRARESGVRLLNKIRRRRADGLKGRDAVGVSRGVQDLQIANRFHETLGQHLAVGAGHDDVCQQQSRSCRCILGHLHGVGCVAREYDRVAVPAKPSGAERPDVVVVFDQQNSSVRCRSERGALEPSARLGRRHAARNGEGLIPLLARCGR